MFTTMIFLARVATSPRCNKEFEVLRDNPQGVALAELVAAFNEPMESVEQALRDLADRGIVNEEGGRYKLIFSRVKAVGG